MLTDELENKLLMMNAGVYLGQDGKYYRCQDGVNAYAVQPVEDRDGKIVGWISEEQLKQADWAD